LDSEEVNSYYSSTRSFLLSPQFLLVPMVNSFSLVDRGGERVRTESKRLGREFDKFGKGKGSREAELGKKESKGEVLMVEKKILVETPSLVEEEFPN